MIEVPWLTNECVLFPCTVSVVDSALTSPTTSFIRTFRQVSHQPGVQDNITVAHLLFGNIINIASFTLANETIVMASPAEVVHTIRYFDHHNTCMFPDVSVNVTDTSHDVLIM